MYPTSGQPGEVLRSPGAALPLPRRGEAGLRDGQVLQGDQAPAGPVAYSHQGMLFKIFRFLTEMSAKDNTLIPPPNRCTAIKLSGWVKIVKNSVCELKTKNNIFSSQVV